MQYCESATSHIAITVFGALVLLAANLCCGQEPVTIEEIIATGVEQLINLQDEDGAWPYEGVYRVRGKIPVGYRVGGTAICCEALMYGTSAEHAEANQSIRDGVELILKELKDPLMEPSVKDRYDVRIWGHIYALDLFCRVKSDDRFADLHEQLVKPIDRLTDAVVHEQIESGGWNYAGRQAHAPFVTAPALQALLWAKQQGQGIDEEVFRRSIKALLDSYSGDGGFAYSGQPSESFMNRQPGSIARTPVAEFTLHLVGFDRQDELAASIDAFHEHWDELEKRRKKSGTHKPPYGIAPYYFYYGHRYLAQAIGGLPEKEQAAETKRFRAVLLKTRDEDGTWNDRVFKQSATYGTAMAVLGLLGDNVPSPEKMEVELDEQ